jgi:ssRNA-specific RNase YbeY (16S rRNA maturation enzyme)
MPVIQFFQEKIRFKLPHPRKTLQWIVSVVKSENKKPAAINFIFCSDQYLKTLNVEYLEHNTFTDVITFDFTR